MPLNDDGHPRLAVKELKKPPLWSDAEFEKAADKEADVLEIMNSSPHPHFITPIAYCKTDESHSFLFPWAEDGNLRDYWRNNDPSLAQDYLEWVFAQLAGLAGA